MTLPRFTPAPVPVIDQGIHGTHVDYANPPTCSACGDIGGPLDASGLCRPCFRAGPWAAAFLEARGLGSAAQEERRVLEHENRLLRAALEDVDPAAWSRLFPGGVRLNTGEQLVAPIDEVAGARTAREVPRLTDEASAAGVSVDVALVPKAGPRKKGT